MLLFLIFYSRPLLRRSSEGGIGTSDGLATQSIDPTLMNSVGTTGGHVGVGGIQSGVYNSTTASAAAAAAGLSSMVTPGSTRRAYSSMSGRYPRSWHPSPFASDDEAASATDEPQFYKEEKKNRIKMEIARRRQQIEENACLHDELTRLAKLRETAEISDRLNVMPTANAYGTPMSPAMAAAAAAAAAAGGHHANGTIPGLGNLHIGTTGGVTTAGGIISNSLGNHISNTVGTGAVTGPGTSVLKSVDEILRSTTDPMASTDLYHHHNHPTTTSTMYGLGDHRVTDFSPMSTMPTAANAYGSVYRSSSADPTLAASASRGGIGGYASSNHLTSTMGNHVTSSTLGGGVGGIGIASTDPYAGVGKYHSTYGNSTGGMLTSGVGTGVTSSSLYRKY